MADQAQTQPQPQSPVDALIERLGNRTGRLQTQLDYANIQIEVAQQRIQELEAERDELKQNLDDLNNDEGKGAKKSKG